jgi:hypothetical protein
MQGMEIGVTGSRVVYSQPFVRWVKSKRWTKYSVHPGQNSRKDLGSKHQGALPGPMYLPLLWDM